MTKGQEEGIQEENVEIELLLLMDSMKQKLIQLYSGLKTIILTFQRQIQRSIVISIEIDIKSK